MPCTQFASSSEVKLYYAVDPEPSLAVPDTTAWNAVRMTGESLDTSITTTISDEITTARSFADSTPSQGEVSGGINFEMSYGTFDDFIIATLQSSDSTWASGTAIKNESTKGCYMFLKVVTTSAGDEYYLYRGCQIDSMSLSMQPGAMVTGTINVQGTGASVQTTPGTSWTYNAAPTTPLMTGTDSLKNLTLSVVGGAAISTTFQSLELTFGNQLRQQQAVGTGSIYAAGVASGRFQCTMNAAMYYTNKDVYDNFVQNKDLALAFDLEDSAGTTSGNTYSFLMGKVKITAGGAPQAGGPDQDLIANATMQAFEDATTGTLQITRTDAV